MSVLDIILLVIILAFVWKGFRSGLVGSIGSLIGVLVAIWAGTHYMQIAAAWLQTIVDLGNEPLANILGFIAIFIAVNIVFGIIIWVINKIFHIIPFIDLANKLLGAGVGLIGGALTIAIVVYLLGLFPISDTIAKALIDSQIAGWANSISVVVKPFIPEAVKQVQSIL